MTTPTNVWSHWFVNLWLLLPLLVVIGLFIRGLVRTGTEGITTRKWGIVAFAGGLFTLCVALISPLDPLTEMLFSVHMVQYTLLTVLAPALLIFSRSSNLLFEGLPVRASTAVTDWYNRSTFFHHVWKALNRRPIIGLIDVGTLYFWHLPGIYMFSLASGPIHALSLFSFLGAGLLSWRLVRQPGHGNVRSYSATLAFLFSTSALGVVLGMALFFSGSLWYPIYQTRTLVWGVAPLLDQQVGGIILGVVPEMFDAIPFLIVVAALLRAEEKHTEERLDLP